MMRSAQPHGYTMGYVSDPFRIEELANLSPEGAATPAHGVIVGRKVAFYDANAKLVYVEVSAGRKYDLKTRKLVE